VVNGTEFIIQLSFLKIAENFAFTLGSRPDGCQVIAAENDIQCRRYNWLATAG